MRLKPFMTLHATITAPALAVAEGRLLPGAAARRVDALEPG